MSKPKGRKKVPSALKSDGIRVLIRRPNDYGFLSIKDRENVKIMIPKGQYFLIGKSKRGFRQIGRNTAERGIQARTLHVIWDSTRRHLSEHVSRRHEQSHFCLYPRVSLGVGELKGNLSERWIHTTHSPPADELHTGTLHSQEEAMVWRGMETACRLALIYR